MSARRLGKKRYTSCRLTPLAVATSAICTESTPCSVSSRAAARRRSRRRSPGARRRRAAVARGRLRDRRSLVDAMSLAVLQDVTYERPEGKRKCTVRTEICDRLGLEFPIFAFSHCRDVVAAVSKAGGIGVLGAVYFTPDELEMELKWIDDHVDGKPYGVDLVMPAKVQLPEGVSAEDLEGQLEQM